jgi:hypothetical protein
MAVWHYREDERRLFENFNEMKKILLRLEKEYRRIS